MIIAQKIKKKLPLMASMPIVLLVVGATGTQGCAVVQACAGHNGFAEVRCVTRTPESAAARALLQLGANVTLVRCDLYAESASVPALLDGVHVVWFNSVGRREDQRFLGLRFVDALALRPGVRVIYSTLPPVNVSCGVLPLVFCPALMLGRHPYPQIGVRLQNAVTENYTKAIIQAALRERVELVRFVVPGFYPENWLRLWPLTRRYWDKVLTWWSLPTTPEHRLPLLVVPRMLGAVVRAIALDWTALRPEDDPERPLHLSHASPTMVEMVDIISSAVREPVVFAPEPADYIGQHPRHVQLLLDFYGAYDFDCTGHFAADRSLLARAGLLEEGALAAWAEEHWQELSRGSRELDYAARATEVERALALPVKALLWGMTAVGLFNFMWRFTAKLRQGYFGGGGGDGDDHAMD